MTQDPWSSPEAFAAWWFANTSERAVSDEGLRSLFADIGPDAFQKCALSEVEATNLCLRALESKDAWDVATWLIHNYLKNSIPLPKALSQLASALVVGVEFPKTRGRKRNTERDRLIVMAVEQIVGKWQIPTYRSKPPRENAPPSACSIVADALCLAETSVETIWQRHLSEGRSEQ
ncbi:hypothetical protein [Tropicimonas sediminicola]|uniref:hypothetical protein n=1 Tax=Tropicimonas sediminicola TaxID=1031541 RepID=UPI00112FF475|nr:hypothetical protein [Tropicimonas sediminicola]